MNSWLVNWLPWSVVAGIDVGKANLDVSISEGPVSRFENTAKGIAKLLKHLKELQSSAPMARRAALYRTVPGVGALTAATLVAHSPELGHWDSKALTSLVGVAPWFRGSGQKRGQSAIRGGRRVVRRALYICAWSVIRGDGQIRRFYQSLRQRGKPGKVALVAVMPKLLLQLNAVARRGTPWVAQTG